MIIAFSQILTAYDRLGYTFDQQGLNLIGIRDNQSDADRDANAFNDRILAAWYDHGRPILLSWPATTDPGRIYRLRPVSKAGTAILTPGQHINLWTLGSHRGAYQALVQNTPCTVYRDTDRDAAISTDKLPTERGFFGINLHRTAESFTPTLVDRWSAGCQVIPDYDDFAMLLALARKAARAGQTALTYTLLTTRDLNTWTH